MLTSPDFKELLSLFKKYNVKYLVVGGYAVIKYSEPRFKKTQMMIAPGEYLSGQNVPLLVPITTG